MQAPDADPAPGGPRTPLLPRTSPTASSGNRPLRSPDEKAPAELPEAAADAPPEAEGGAGLMIIRAWLEPGSTAPLRAKVRIVADLSTGVEQTLTFSRADEVCATVERWLADISGPELVTPG